MSLPEHLETLRGVDYEIDAAGCWVWLKGKNKAGYPWGYTHRRYWEAANGPRPDGWHIHHKCKNTACVNPEHLEAVASVDHRHLHLQINKGLTLDDVREIRRLGREGVLTALEVSERYGISFKSVYNYWNGKRWAEAFGELEEVRGASRMCPHCDEQFSSNNRHATYCSKRCQQNAWNKRNRQEKRRVAA